MSDGARLTWTKGGEGEALSLDGDRITVRSTIPSAPGSRLDGAAPSGGTLRVKVARCRRQDPIFVIDGRLIDTTREVRAELARLLADAPTSDGSEGPPGA